MNAEQLERMYAEVCAVPSDINEHCPLLRELAEQCEHATELGTRYGTSTIALAAGCIHGRLRYLVSYDIEDCRHDDLTRYSGGVAQFVRASSLDVSIDRTDLLLIDTEHTEQQLAAELQRHHHNVRRWIVTHDTQSMPELREVIDRFIAANRQWTIWRHFINNNGLTILQRS